MIVPRWSLTLALLAFPAVTLAATPTRHVGIQGGLHTKATFLEVQADVASPVATVKPTHSKGPASRSAFIRAAPPATPMTTQNQRVHSMTHPPPGFMTGIFGVLLILAVGACVHAWNRAFPVDEELLMDDATFQAFVDKGELDFYTCMALSVGHHKTFRVVARYIPGLVVLVCMQFVLPIMLMVVQAGKHTYFPTTQGNAHRAIGAMLFAYSSWNLHCSMNDEFRTHVIEMMLTRHVSGWYSWPIVFGESMNTFLASVLMLILFLIFCRVTQPQELLLNCIAINFVADIDNQLVSDKDIEHAAKDHHSFIDEWKRSPLASQVLRQANLAVESPISARQGDPISPHEQAPVPDEEQSVPESGTGMLALDILQMCVLHANKLVRQLVPIVAGILVFLFAFANNEAVCHHVRKVEPWPFCFTD